MDTLLPPIFDEGFETFTPKEKAEKLVDVLLDMCGSPHMKKRGRERGMSESSVDDGTFSLNGRPYDAPRQVRIRPIVDIIDVEDEQDVKECDDGDYGASPERDNFEGAETSTGEEEEPAIGPSLTNKINNVPNQNAPALLKAIKSDLMEAGYQAYFQSMLSKHGVSSPAELSGDKKKAFFNAVNKGWKGKAEATNERMVMKAVSSLAKKMNALQAARKAKGLAPISRKQAARMVSISAAG